MKFPIRQTLPELCVFTLLFSFWGSFASAQIRSDEEVLFFPTAARLNDSGDTWLVPIHGWIFEPERGSFARRAIISRLVDELGLNGEGDADARRILSVRAHWLLADNERGKRIEIAVGERRHMLPPSAEDGHFEDVLELPDDFVAGLAEDGQLKFRAVLPGRDEREFTGAATLATGTGMTVISDIDDTVKISEVGQRNRLLRRTFVEPFAAVDGMAERYRSWHANGALVWFVSAGPWQLYSPLQAFLAQAGFPPAFWEMQRVRVLDSSILNLFGDPYEYKLTELTQIIEAFPRRRFALIGDSGEKDPEAYGEVARRFPEQVVCIAIRDVTDENASADRYQDAFRNVPPDRWRIFHDPAEVELPAAE